jgi:hypothetical protein
VLEGVFKEERMFFRMIIDYMEYWGRAPFFVPVATKPESKESRIATCLLVVPILELMRILLN